MTLMVFSVHAQKPADVKDKYESYLNSLLTDDQKQSRPSTAQFASRPSRWPTPMPMANSMRPSGQSTARECLNGMMRCLEAIITILQSKLSRFSIRFQRELELLPKKCLFKI